jgi:tetratricopeptide (TPR) repeat protein
MIMKLIRWLFSNIILIAFVLALTYAYVYWDNLTGEDTPAGKAIAYLSVEYDEVREFLDSYDFKDDRVVDARPEPVAEATETASVPQMMPPPRPQVRPPVQQQPAPPREMAQQPPVSQPSVSSQVPPTAMMQQPPASQQAPRPQAPPQAMVQEPPARPPMPQPVTPAREPVPAGPPAAAVADKPASSTRELWISAREEYHRGNIEGSISNYQQVIASSTDNYDAYGELGNVYLSRGKYREAASAYFEAASILVKQGQAGRARSLLPMLERLDRKKAEELHQLINTAGN